MDQSTNQDRSQPTPQPPAPGTGQLQPYLVSDGTEHVHTRTPCLVARIAERLQPLSWITVTSKPCVVIAWLDAHFLVHDDWTVPLDHASEPFKHRCLGTLHIHLDQSNGLHGKLRRRWWRTAQEIGIERLDEHRLRMSRLTPRLFEFVAMGNVRCSQTGRVLCKVEDSHVLILACTGVKKRYVRQGTICWVVQQLRIGAGEALERVNCAASSTSDTGLCPTVGTHIDDSTSKAIGKVERMGEAGVSAPGIERHGR